MGPLIFFSMLLALHPAPKTWISPVHLGHFRFTKLWCGERKVFVLGFQDLKKRVSLKSTQAFDLTLKRNALAWASQSSLEEFFSLSDLFP